VARKDQSRVNMLLSNMATTGLRLWRIPEHTDFDLVLLGPCGYLYLVPGANAMRAILGKYCSPFSGDKYP
jgi:hypothetical protein